MPWSALKQPSVANIYKATAPNLAVLDLKTGGHFSSGANNLLKRLIGSIRKPAAKIELIDCGAS